MRLSAPAPTRLTIDALADRCGVSIRSVRYWIQRGVIPRPHGQFRWAYYDDIHVKAIRDYLANVKDHNVTLAEYAERRGYA